MFPKRISFDGIWALTLYDNNSDKRNYFAFYIPFVHCIRRLRKCNSSPCSRKEGPFMHLWIVSPTLRSRNDDSGVTCLRFRNDVRKEMCPRLQ